MIHAVRWIYGFGFVIRINDALQGSCGSRYENILSEGRELEKFEALLAKRLTRGTIKYKGNLPLKYFNYNIIIPIPSRFPKNN